MTELDIRGKLAYSRAAISSYEVFRRLRDEGVVPEGVRFQAAIPGAWDAISPYFPDPGDWPIVTAAWNRAVQDEHRSDDAYFAPLEDLAPGAAKVFLGLECNDGSDAMQRRIDAASAHLRGFGVAHYCGYLWNRAILPQLLQDLNTGAERLAAQT